MNVAEYIAAAFFAISETVAGPLINLGIAGIVIWWFMTHTEKRLKSIEERLWRAGHELRKAIELSTRSNLLLTLAIGSQPLQAQATEMLRDIDTLSQQADSDHEKHKPV